MGRVGLQRLLLVLFTIWFTASIAFFALRILPGNAIEAQLNGTNLPQEVINQRLSAYGLDKSLIAQYGDFLLNLARGNLGLSLYGGQTVNEVLRQRLPTTIALAGGAMLFAIVFGITLGIVTHLSLCWAQFLGTLSIDLSIAVPVYWTATIVLFVLGSSRNNLMIPMLVLGFHSAGAIARVTSVAIADIHKSQYIRTAYAKGLTPSRIWLIHILRNAMIPVINIIAIQTGILFSGTVITETIFQRSGIGLTLINATLERNYPVVQGIVIYTTVLYVTINALADVLTTALNPRLRAS